MFLFYQGITSFVVASLTRTIRGFKMDSDAHEEAMVPVGGMCECRLSSNIGE